MLSNFAKFGATAFKFDARNPHPKNANFSIKKVQVSPARKR
ncbi:hypothetical protein CAMRE0001_2545 [Campylobacter rectus RM3267]|uniref:Uncharacterized protein n=1 Tax=Campylobacter rectus RM3267 TaxID=553218 RepID=B9D3T1_CAMRE|nr:hypothetical protein CAMRE0001_2545 [Campylobacter rectus RM3267]